MSQIIDQKILFSNDSTANFCGVLTFTDVRNSFPFKMCTDSLTNWDFMLKYSLPEGNVTSTDQESARGKWLWLESSHERFGLFLFPLFFS